MPPLLKTLIGVAVLVEAFVPSGFALADSAGGGWANASRGADAVTVRASVSTGSTQAGHGAPVGAIYKAPANRPISTTGVPPDSSVSSALATTVGGAPNTIRCMASRLPGASDPTACFSAEQVVDSATVQPSAPAKPVITQAMVQGWAEQAASTLTVPASAPSVGPDPANNQWKMLAVGLPVWVWTKDPQTASQTSTTNGITITFRAIRSATTIAWGDGSTSTCATMTARPESAEPMQASPDCGHVYQQKLTATITATSVWTVFWSALGFSGALYVPRSASTQLTVGQLHSVVVHR